MPKESQIELIKSGIILYYLYTMEVKNKDW